MSVADQVVIIWAATNGYIDDLPLDQVARFEQELLAFVHDRYQDIIQRISKEKAISDETRQVMEKAVREFKTQFQV